MNPHQLFAVVVLATSIAISTIAGADTRVDKAKEEKSVLIYGSTQLDQIS
jgi:hypothetical protein